MQWAALWARSGTRALPHEAVEALLILLSIICESSRHSVTVYAPAKWPLHPRHQRRSMTGSFASGEAMDSRPWRLPVCVCWEAAVLLLRL